MPISKIKITLGLVYLLQVPNAKSKVQVDLPNAQISSLVQRKNIYKAFLIKISKLFKLIVNDCYLPS